MEFRWNEWNLEHATRHGVSPEEAEWVAENARRPWPESMPDEKWAVWGRTEVGRMVQVVYVISPADVTYIIHARPLNHREKNRYRRRTGDHR